METLIRDARNAWKLWSRRPGFAIVAVVVLALGIGANTAIFSVVNGVLLRPLPFHNPEQLQRLFETVNRSSMSSNRMEVAPANYLDWQNQTTAFSGLAAFISDNIPLSTNGEAVVVSYAGVAHDFFSVLDVTPIVGRSFNEEEDKPANQFVAVLSFGLWQSRFGGDAGIIGKSLLLDGSNYTVIGVMPQGFDFPNETQVWTPLALNERQVKMREAHFLNVIGRTRSDIRPATAAAEIQAIAAKLAEAYPATNENWGANIVPLLEQEVGKIRPALMVLFATVGLVLLIACANIASLQMARATSRQAELAIRAAIGASRWQIVRQLLTESLMLSLLGGAVGILLSNWLVDAMLALAPQQLPRSGAVRLDLTVLSFTVLVSIVTGVISGLIPAIKASRVDLATMLKEGADRQTSTTGRRVLGTLVVVEVALAMIVLAGSGLLINSFIRMRSVDPGLDVDRILTVRLTPPSAYYDDPNKWSEHRIGFYRQLMPKLEGLPGVESAAAVDSIPLSGRGRVYRFRKEGEPDSNSNPAAIYEVATAGYFATVGMHAVHGRLPVEGDREGTLPVVVINESMARRFWSADDPVGKRIIIRNQEAPREIVGVVNDVKHFGLDRESGPAMYVPYNQAVIDLMPLVIRAKGDPAQLPAAVREQIRAVDPGVAISRIETLRDLKFASMADRRFTTIILSVFGGFAGALAGIGLYGVVAYSVLQRTREIGIRFALGATSRDVIRLTVGRGMRLAVLGVFIGIAGSFVLTRLLAAWLLPLLFEVTPVDPISLSSISLFLISVTFFACWLPSLRAARVDPLIALRHD